MLHAKFFRQSRSSEWLVFFHGFLGGYMDWDDIYSIFLGRYNICLVDLPGHGQSVWPDDCHSIDDFSDLFEKFCVQHKIRSMILVGYSMGGRLAASYTVSYPKRVKQLILESTHLGLQNEFDINLAANQTKERLILFNNYCIENAIQIWYSAPLFVKTKQMMSQSFFNRRLKQDIQGICRCLSSFCLSKQNYLCDQLFNLNISVRYIFGILDIKYMHLAKIYKKFNNIETVCVEGADHMVHFSNKKLFCEYLNI